MNTEKFEDAGWLNRSLFCCTTENQCFVCDTIVCWQQPTEAAPAVRTQEEELIESLRAEFHETACKIQSLQAETESLRTLVSNENQYLLTGIKSSVSQWIAWPNSITRVYKPVRLSIERVKCLKTSVLLLSFWMQWLVQLSSTEGSILKGKDPGKTKLFWVLLISVRAST